jgi:TPR repeat protein
MRRSDIQLLSLVRQGDSLARIEVGSRYLCGSGGFPKNVRTGLDYLTHFSVRDRPEAISAITSNLALDEMLEHGLATTLRRAAEGQCTSAQFKLGIWSLTRHTREAEAAFWLESAAAAGEVAAAMAVAIAREPGNGLLSVLRTLTTSGAVNGAAIATIGACASSARSSCQTRPLRRWRN